jgi:hypothetical protein
MNIAQQIEGFKRRFQGYTGAFKRRVIGEICLGVIRDTPVLTGALQFNWQFTSIAPATGILPPPYSTAVVVNRILADIARLVDDNDEVYFLTNNLHYASYIEFDGHSRKAPAGMLRINVAKADSIIKQVAIG